jgi:ABC-2 type transport system permease protein
MLFISGAFFPLTNVPQWMKIIANINPLAYGVDVLRQIILNNQVTDNISNDLFLHSISTNILFLIIFSIIMVGAAVSAFDKKE